MIKITPGVTACKLTIRVRAAKPGCEAEITYSHTSLGPEGDVYLASFTAEYYVQFMRGVGIPVESLPEARHRA